MVHDESMSGLKQKIEIYLGNDASNWAYVSLLLGHPGCCLWQMGSEAQFGLY